MYRHPSTARISDFSGRVVGARSLALTHTRDALSINQLIASGTTSPRGARMIAKFSRTVAVTPINAPEPSATPPALWATAKQVLWQRGRLAGWLVAAAPALSFVVVSGLDSLRLALLVSGLTAAAGFAWQLLRRRGLRQAIGGVCVAGVCAAVAESTGEARGFFLIPAALPFAILVVCLVSVLIRRPLTGVLLNRVCGGPPDWCTERRVRRIYTSTTLACVAVNVLNGTLQVVFYAKGDTLVLAALHVMTGPVFAVIVGVTVVRARRAVADLRLELAARPL